MGLAQLSEAWTFTHWTETLFMTRLRLRRLASVKRCTHCTYCRAAAEFLTAGKFPSVYWRRIHLLLIFTSGASLLTTEP